MSQRKQGDLQDKFNEFMIALAVIVETMGMFVYNDTKVDTIKDEGGEVVTWTTHGEWSKTGPCGYCDDLDGLNFPIDEVPEYPAHTNCTCTLEYANNDAELSDASKIDDYQTWRTQGVAKQRLLSKWVKKDERQSKTVRKKTSNRSG